MQRTRKSKRTSTRHVAEEQSLCELVECVKAPLPPKMPCLTAEDRHLIRMLHGSKKLASIHVNYFVTDLLDRRWFYEDSVRQTEGKHVSIPSLEDAILYVAKKEWQLENGQKGEHFLHDKVRDLGALQTCVQFANDELCGEGSVYVNLIRHTVFNYGEKVLYKMLLQIPKHALRFRLVVEAMNQIFETWYRESLSDPHALNCDCTRCQRDFCFKGSLWCTCEHRRKQNHDAFKKRKVEIAQENL